MKSYKIIDSTTGLFLSKSKEWSKRGRVWQSYPSEVIRQCKEENIEIVLGVYELKLITTEVIK